MRRITKILVTIVIALLVIASVLIFWNTVKFWLLAAIALALVIWAIRFFLRIPQGQGIEEKVKTGAKGVALLVLAYVLGAFAYNARPQWLSQPQAPRVVETQSNSVAIIEPTALPEPTALATATMQQPPVSTFGFVLDVPSCVSLNGAWTEAFAKGLIYEVKPAKGGLPTDGTFTYFEGVVVGSEPKDTHSVFQVQKDFKAEQGNFWACAGQLTDNQKFTILFQSADKKWQNLDSQKLAHPMAITDPSGKVWRYASGEKPAWALSKADTDLVCPYSEPTLQDPAGALLANGTFIGAPGKAGCDFIVISPDGNALRYSGSQDGFKYQSGSRFFLFDPKWSNENLASTLNLGKVKNAK